MKPTNREKILSLFFDRPTKPFQIREASRLSGIGLPSVRNYLLSLEKERILKKAEGQVFPYFIANRESRAFRMLKANGLRRRIEESGLIAELGKGHPDCIVLFGSAARGEDTEKSDLDIFAQMRRRETSLAKFGKALNRGINILFEPNPGKLSAELKNNIANGVVLDGYLKLF